MVENIPVVEPGLRPVEAGLDQAQGLFGHVRQFVQHGDHIALADHLDPGLLFGGRCVHALEPGAMGRGPQNPGVQHPGPADVPAVQSLPRYLFVRIPAQKRLAHDPAFGRRLERRDLVQMLFDYFAPGQPAVRHPVVRLLPVEDHAVVGHEPVRRAEQVIGGQFNERSPGFGGRFP